MDAPHLKQQSPGLQGDDLGDGEFYYSSTHGREDLTTLIGERTDLGQIMTSGRVSRSTSILAQA